MNNHKIVEHIKENKKLYIGLGIGTVVGLAVGVVVVKTGNISKINMVRFWSPGDNNIMKVYINPLGDPGNVIQNMDTGTVWASQGQAARELGVDPSTISKHLSGLLPHVKGNRLMVIGKAGQAIAE